MLTTTDKATLETLYQNLAEAARQTINEGFDIEPHILLFSSRGHLLYPVPLDLCTRIMNMGQEKRTSVFQAMLDGTLPPPTGATPAAIIALVACGNLLMQKAKPEELKQAVERIRSGDLSEMEKQANEVVMIQLQTLTSLHAQWIPIGADGRVGDLPPFEPEEAEPLIDPRAKH